MNTLPSGILLFLSQLTGLPKQHISDYLNGRRNMSKERAIELEETTFKKGSFFTKENWMFYPEKIRQQLIESHKHTQFTRS